MQAYNVTLIRNLQMKLNWRVKAHYKRINIVATLYNFLKVPYFNFNHVIIRKDFFTIFLDSIVGQNPKVSNAKEITFFYFICYDVRIYFAQIYTCHSVLKDANLFKKWLKCFLIFMKFIVCTKHCDSIWLE